MQKRRSNNTKMAKNIVLVVGMSFVIILLGVSWLEYKCRADITRDNLIDIEDLVHVAIHMKEKVRQNPSIEYIDVDKSGMIGMRDLKFVARWVGENVGEDGECDVFYETNTRRWR